jgi:hypothetical protein
MACLSSPFAEKNNMFFMDVNLWAVLVAAVATMVLGFLWYSPALFARPWMLAMGYDPDDTSRIKQMVTAFVLGKIIDITTVDTAVYGMKVAFAVWLGFVTTVQLTAKLFGNQPTKLYLINTGYQLVCYLAMGAILAEWPK